MADVDWDEMTDAVPAVVTALAMPFTFSIATGIGLGFITYVAVKALSGRFSEVSPAMYAVAAVFVVYFWTG
jgi:AGZA family xanthine/uracil permease-like MFS transporter